MKKWYQKNFRRLLIDMHIPDWDERFLRDFSPENYAEMLKLANVGCAEIYAGSCLGLCYWPTRIGYRHQQFKERDLLHETLAACRKRGLKTVIYLNVWNRMAYDMHPEWRLIDIDGKGTVDADQRRYAGMCCPNTPYRKFFLELLDELNSSYCCDGLWIDMIGWFWRVCHCVGCQARFKRETGHDVIPGEANWDNPVFLSFQQCRENWLAEFAGEIRTVVKERTPERSLALQVSSFTAHGWKGAVCEDFLRVSDYLAGDFTGGHLQQSYICKMLSSFSKNKPFEFMTPRCETLRHHTTERTYENMEMRLFAAIANQASFTLIDAIDPSGTLDRRFYERAGRINATYARYEKYLDSDSVPLCDLAVYHCPSGSVPLQKNIPEEKQRYVILAETFIKEHILFSYAHGHDSTALAKFPLIILSDIARLSEKECVALEEYVFNGGRIYASAHTSLYDRIRGKRNDFRLAEMFGVHYAGAETGPVSYIAPAAKDFPAGVVRDYPLMLDSGQLNVQVSPEADVLGTLTLPCSSPDEFFRFGSAISDPPMNSTSKAALTRHNFGKGEVIYVAGMLEGMPYALHRKVFTGLLRKLMPHGPILATNAPGIVEVTAFMQTICKRLVINILNLPPDSLPVPLTDLWFKLRLPGKIKARGLFIAPEDHPLPFCLNDNIIEFNLPRLEQFALLTVTYEEQQ